MQVNATNTRIRTDACCLCSSKEDSDKTSHLSTRATDGPQESDREGTGGRGKEGGYYQKAEHAAVLPEDAFSALSLAG